MSTHYDLPEDVDFLLVRRDDELLDAIAQREHGYDTLGELAGDPALSLLAAFATDVDDGLERLLAELEPAVGAEPVSPVVPVVPRQATRRAERRPLPSTAAPGRTVVAPSATRPARRAHLGRAGAAAAVAAAVISVSGVAAAVTGNPLAPMQKVAQTVQSVFGHGPNQHANDRAKLEASLHDVDALIRAGRYAEAQALLDQLTGQVAALDAKQQNGLQKQLAALEARLDREVAKTAQATPPGATKAPNSNKPTAQPTQAQPSHSPKPTPTHTSGSGTTHNATTPTPPAVVTPPAPGKTHTGPTHSPKSGGATRSKTG